MGGLSLMWRDGLMCLADWHRHALLGERAARSSRPKGFTPRAGRAGGGV